MEFDKTIYKKDSKGKIRFLRAFSHKGELVQFSGIVGSDKHVEHRSKCEGKNIGKANETTPEQQAAAEAEKKLVNKMSSGYFETIEEAEGNSVVLPMLAKDGKKEIPKIDWNGDVFVQPKLDGMRALGKAKADMISRKGKVIDTVTHIQAELDMLMNIDILDGELYAHGLNFQENMRLIKKYRPDETEKVKFHVYDLILPNLAFKNRYSLLSELVKPLDNIELVPTFRIHNEQQLKEAHAKFLSEGYEGTIIRHGNAGLNFFLKVMKALLYVMVMLGTGLTKEIVSYLSIKISLMKLILYVLYYQVRKTLSKESFTASMTKVKLLDVE
jgi:DNA ligase-1